MLARLFLFVACLAAALPSLSQVGHPAKGSWAGFLNPLGDAQSEQTRIRLLIDDHNGELSGVINPGRRGVDAGAVSLDAPSWTLTIQADTPDGALELVGKLENLGSWTNRRYSGYYSLGEQKGTFSVTLN